MHGTRGRRRAINNTREAAREREVDGSMDGWGGACLSEQRDDYHNHNHNHNHDELDIY